MASNEKPLTYEEERQRIIEENKRRMQELGLMETAESFQRQSTTRKTPIRRVSINLEFAIETRRSSRAASRPRVDYKEVRRPRVDHKEASVDIGLRRTRGIGRPLLRRGYVSPAAKNEAAVRAGDVKTSHPSFVKAMLKSHTSGGFWLGLPSDFCNRNFTKDDIVKLEDEEGLEWECVYLHNKHGLSGGWRGFSLDHDLEDGDAVVFELVTSSRFKGTDKVLQLFFEKEDNVTSVLWDGRRQLSCQALVYITRAGVSEEPFTQKAAAAAKKRDYQYAVKDSKNVHVHSVSQKGLKGEKGEQFDGKKGEVCRRSKSAKTTKKNVRKGRYDRSSDESQDSEDDVEDTSEDESDSADENIEQSDKEAPAQSTDEDIQPARKLKDKITGPAKRSVKSKQDSPIVNIENSEEEPEQKSDDDTRLATNSKRKISQVPKIPAKSKQQLTAKTKSKARQITPGRKETSRVLMKVVKKETFVRRADRKTDTQEFRKEIAARQIEQKCNLPPGTRLKPVGVCSIARGSTKRKLPAIFPARKYSFFSGPKSIKVH